MERGNNKGFSLVELIVSIAILGIVMAAILSFFVFATREYHSGGSETMVQTEAQMITRRIEDLIINAADGVGTNAARDELYIFDHETVGGSTVYKKITIKPDTSLLRLLYNCENYSYDASSGTFSSTGSTGDSVLAECVKEITVDLSTVPTNYSVQVTFHMKQRDREYNTTSVFVLRNRGITSVSDDVNEHFVAE